MQDIRQSVQYADYLKKEGWIVERIEGINYFIKNIPVIGSVLKLQRPEKINFQTIDRLCRKYGIFQIILEPNLVASSGIAAIHNSIVHRGFKLSKSPFLPSKTLQIDLTQSEKTILTQFKKDARRAVKRGEVNNIKVLKTPTEIREWRKAWKNSVNFDRYVPTEDQLLNLRKSFGAKGSLFLASHNISGSIIGGALFTASLHGVSKYITYYWHGFTNKEGRSSLSQYSLLYQGILWAKKNGCKIFDFEGIYDERFPNKSWLGFSHFKRSFGGKEVLYPGCYTKFRLPL